VQSQRARLAGPTGTRLGCHALPVGVVFRGLEDAEGTCHANERIDVAPAGLGLLVMRRADRRHLTGGRVNEGVRPVGILEYEYVGVTGLRACGRRKLALQTPGNPALV
jgi:hypothetical protein